MKELMNVNVLTMSSDEMAKLTETRPDNVKRTIETLVARGTIQHPQIEEVKNHLGQTVKLYQVRKRDSFIVVAQLSPEFTGRVVDRWLELEAGQRPKTQLELAREQVALLERLETIEIERRELKVTLDLAHDWSSVKRMEMRDDMKYCWPPLRTFSRANDYDIKRVFDQNYGEVNSYHRDVWFAVYGVIVD